MVEFLTGLGRANLAAVVAILAVLALRKPVRSLFGARIAYGLWALPALSVAAAFLPARVLLVPALSRAPAVEGPVQILTFDGAASPAAHSVIDPSQALLILWVAGVIAAFGILIRSQRRFLADAAGGHVGPAVVGVISPRIIKPEDSPSASATTNNGWSWPTRPPTSPARTPASTALSCWSNA